MEFNFRIKNHNTNVIKMCKRLMIILADGAVVGILILATAQRRQSDGGSIKDDCVVSPWGEWRYAIAQKM